MYLYTDDAIIFSSTNLLWGPRLQRLVCKWSCNSGRRRGRAPTSLSVWWWWRWKPSGFWAAQEALEAHRYVESDKQHLYMCAWNDRWKWLWWCWWGGGWRWQLWWWSHNPAGHGAGRVNFRMRAAEWWGLNQFRVELQVRNVLLNPWSHKNGAKLYIFTKGKVLMHKKDSKIGHKNTIVMETTSITDDPRRELWLICGF